MPESHGSDFFLPASDKTVSVKAIDGGRIALAPADLVWSPVVPGRETFDAISYAFLVESQSQNKSIMFDLGIRKDIENATPANTKWFKLPNGPKVIVERDVASQLRDGGVDLESINAIIWSHSHIDHIGDTSKFPSSTELVLGPGSIGSLFPLYPENPESGVQKSDFAGRKVTEIQMEDFDLDIGGFKAHDYFGDGSFYVLNVPGHAVGHVAALARVTPLTFIFLGADTCHHAGMLRPNLGIHKHYPCPGHLIFNSVSHHFYQEGETTAMSSRSRPLLTIAVPKADTQCSIDIAANFDAHPDVWVVLAHDTSLQGTIELFPATLNQWKEKRWKERVIWAFLEENGPAFRFKPKNI